MFLPILTKAKFYRNRLLRSYKLSDVRKVISGHGVNISIPETAYYDYALTQADLGSARTIAEILDVIGLLICIKILSGSVFIPSI